MNNPDKEFIYIGDPMCSWCYGFSPVIQALYRKHKNDVKMTLTVGGLHVGDNCIHDDRRAEFLREHWQEIGERSGQPFKLDILDKKGWLYDTETACRAVVAMRGLRPGAEFPYFAAIQSGFYAENRDSNADATYAEAALNFGVEAEEFLACYHDPATKEETLNDFRWSQSIGITGFPSVLVRDKEDYAALTLGYQPLEAIEAPLANWLGS